MTTTTWLVASVAVLMSIGAQAELMHTDWQQDGDRKATLDTDTGLEWLKLDYSRQSGKLASYDAKVQPDGELEGWRQATQMEVENLMTSLFPWATPQAYHYDNDNFFPDSERDGIAMFRTYFGISSGFDSHYSYGAYKDAQGDIRAAGVSTWYDGNVALDSNPIYYKNASDVYMAGWYVSDGGLTVSSINDPFLNIKNPNAPVNSADVSAPMWGVSLLAVGGLAGFRRRQHT